LAIGHDAFIHNSLSSFADDVLFFYAFWNFVASKVQFLEDRSSFVMANVNKQKKINLSLKWSNWGFGAESAFCHFLIKRYCTAIHFTPSVNINVT